MRLPFFGRRTRREAELEEEIRTHLEMAVRERVARGEDRTQAEHAARREFGSAVVVKEVTRQQWRGARFERVLRELRHALRGLVRAPGFALTAVLVLGLGIGMATAMFTVFDAVLVQPLPVQAPDRVVLPQTLDPSGVDVGLAPEELDQLADGARTLSAAAGIAHFGSFPTTLLDGDRVLAMREAWVTGNFFTVLGARPVLGRFFDAPDQMTPGTMSGPIVLSYDAWLRDFGGDSTVIGHTVGSPYTHERSTIIGVAPPGLAYPEGTQYWMPLAYASMDVMARLAPGATAEAARTEFFSVVRRMSEGRAAAGRFASPLTSSDVQTFTHAVLGDVRPQLLALAAAVGLLLLIACVNVGNLVLLRATTRTVETAVRRALGAGTADIVRAMVLEVAALAIGGGLLGLALARAMLLVLPGLAPPDLPRLDVIRLAPTPLALAAAATAAALLLAGLFPALAAARGALAATLRMDARAGLGGAGRNRLRQALVASQIGLAMVMLAGTGLLVRSMERLARIPLGYRAEALSILTLAKPVQPDSVMAEMTALYDLAAPALRALPAIASITPIAADPFHGPQVFTSRWALPGQSDAEAESNPMIPFEVGGRDYFTTFQIPILRGRGFLDTDREDAPPVVVVSRAVAERFWPGENPVGKQLRFAADTTASSWHTVVGEAGDIRFRSLRQATPSVYLPWRQLFFQGEIAIRTRGSLASALPAIRRVVRAVDPEATVLDATPMDDLIARQSALPRLSTLLFSAFGLTALLLAAIGLYGLMAAAVRERTRELGIRSALGATPGRLRAGVLTEAGIIAGAGALAGLAVALAGARFLASLLFEVGPSDPTALAAAGLLLLAVALLAAYVPAWRATRADPTRALRAE